MSFNVDKTSVKSYALIQTLGCFFKHRVYIQQLCGQRWVFQTIFPVGLVMVTSKPHGHTTGNRRGSFPARRGHKDDIHESYTLE